MPFPYLSYNQSHQHFCLYIFPIYLFVHSNNLSFPTLHHIFVLISENWTHGTFDTKEEAIQDALGCKEWIERSLSTDNPIIYVGDQDSNQSFGEIQTSIQITCPLTIFSLHLLHHHKYMYPTSRR